MHRWEKNLNKYFRCGIVSGAGVRSLRKDSGFECLPIFNTGGNFGLTLLND